MVADVVAVEVPVVVVVVRVFGVVVCVIVVPVCRRVVSLVVGMMSRSRRSRMRDRGGRSVASSSCEPPS